MAKEFEDAEFWLPSEFLDDDFFVEEEKSVTPVESVTGTESDEEEYMAGLTRRMAHSFLLDDGKEFSGFATAKPQGKVLASSPQSTLSAMGSWSPSQVTSPPTSPLEKPKEDPLDLLYEAAGQVMRLRQNNYSQVAQTQQSFQSRELLYPTRKPSPLQAAQFHHLRQQQLLKQQQFAWGRQNRASAPLGLSQSAWPPLQKPQQTQPSSGMRAVFLSGAGAKRESAGTGVFLPRRTGTPTEPRKKPTCSTVLLPARVVQTLNLNLEELGAQPRYPGGFVLDHDALMGRRSATMQSHQKRSNHHLQTNHHPVPAHEIRLPQEWTY
ncbi:uncharacterized protein [Typha angustifolia]|uniref:uncharacterized protein n=1 Tax=Typha angustifolia TaxID=59011 RepID=UPI003C2F3354